MGWAVAVARALTRSGVSPNTISAASVVFGALAGGAFLASSRNGSPWIFVAAAACIQLRLACNLFDGMVAVEGGKQTRSGEIWNDLPDRLSDVLTIVPVGVALRWGATGVTLGWIAGCLALLTAYVRILGGACGLPQSFAGPMAKQQRMATLTAGALLAAAESAAGFPARALGLALAIVALGAAVTAVRRTLAIVRALESR